MLVNRNSMLKSYNTSYVPFILAKLHIFSLMKERKKLHVNGTVQ